jgi:erythronate-4-phosphate dehydrogenase
MKVIADENIPFVKEAFAEFGEIVTVPGRDITHELIADAEMVLVRSVTRVDEKLLNRSPVKFVGSATTGIDHIDTEYLFRNSIGFSNAPGSNAESVAEYVIASLLYVAEKKQLTLDKMTIGIIGVGNVGSKVFIKAQALGMKCLLNDPPKQKAAKSALFCSLKELIEQSDVVTLHVPLIPDGEGATCKLVNKEILGKMKTGVVLINTSRGGIIDEHALMAIAADKLGGLIMDVWEDEPNINTDLLYYVDIASPHIAGYSYEGKVRGTAMIHEAACAFFFMERQWQEFDILSGLHGGIIDVSKSKRTVHDAVLQAYPIANDDDDFRNVMKFNKVRKGPYFDELRKNYRRRLEFSHYSVKNSPACKQENDVLSVLGFTMV